MFESRKCPDCKKHLPPGSGTTFDADHNVVCVFCGGMVLAAKSDKERKSETAAVTTPTGHEYGYPHMTNVGMALHNRRKNGASHLHSHYREGDY